MDAFLFWVMKPIAEIALVLALVAAVGLLYAVACIPSYLRQRKCEHERVREDGACNAWCSECGKNLGFIGTWREKRKGS